MSEFEVDIEVPCGDFNKRRILGGIFTCLFKFLQFLKEISNLQGIANYFLCCLARLACVLRFDEFLKSFDNFLTHSNSLFQEIFRTQKVTSLFQLICLSKVTQSERDNKIFCNLYKCPVHYICRVYC